MTATTTMPLRRNFLTRKHALQNIGWVVFAHATLVFVFWAGYQLMPLILYVPLALIAAVAHQKMMSEWVHEAAHYNLVPDKRWNDVLGTTLCGVFLGNTVAIYRAGHMRHHSKQEFFEPDDTDTNFCFVRDRRELWQGVLGDISGINAVKAYLRLYLLPSLRKTSEEKRTSMLSLVALLAVPHGVAIVGLWWLGRLDAYVFYYVSILMLYPLFNRIRAYGQHVDITPEGRGEMSGSEAARTIDAGFLDRLFFTSRVMMYHHEHHAHPSLPFRACRVIAELQDEKRLHDVNSYCRSRWLPVRALLAGLPRRAAQ